MEVVMKKLLIGVGVLVVVLVVALAYVWTNLDSIVKSAIQTYGSEAVKTDVRVDSVKLELTDGKASIKGLTVANPAGFTDPYIFSLGEISTKVDVSTVNKNPIVIDEIHIAAPAVFYEINKSGVANADVLKKNVAGSSGGSKSSSSSSSSSSGDEVKLIIRKLIIEGTSATVRIAALGKDQTVALKKIVMTDVGKKSGGATAAEVAAQVSDKMLANVQSAVTKIGVNQYLGKSADDIKAQMQQKLGGSTGGSKDAVGGALKGLLGN